MGFPAHLSWGSIDGMDLMTELNFAVESGSDTFRALKEPKEVYTKDWPKEAGIQYDFSAPFVPKARVFVLKGWILSDNSEEFKSNCDYLEEVLKAPYFPIYCKKYDITVYARLKSFPQNIQTPVGVPFNNFTAYGAELTIEFDEIYLPSNINLPPVVYTGGNKQITLPVSSLLNSGATATPRSGSTIASIGWIFVGGPQTPEISNPTILNPTFSGLTIPGNYIFKLTVTDSNGLSAFSTKTINVLEALELPVEVGKYRYKNISSIATEIDRGNGTEVLAPGQTITGDLTEYQLLSGQIKSGQTLVFTIYDSSGVGMTTQMPNPPSVSNNTGFVDLNKGYEFLYKNTSSSNAFPYTFPFTLS